MGCEKMCIVIVIIWDIFRYASPNNVFIVSLVVTDKFRR